MHLKRLYHTVHKVMCHWINRTCRVLPHFDIHYVVPYGGPKKCIIARIRGFVYKVLVLNSAILLHLYG